MNYIPVRFAFIFPVCALCCLAQESVSAGGKWVRVANIDRATGQKSVSFVLAADDSDADRHASISITCSTTSKAPSIVYNADISFGASKLDPLNYWLPATRPQIKVDDEKIYKPVWDIIQSDQGKRATLDRKTLHHLVTGLTMRVRFSDASDESHLDEFTLSGLNVNELRETCGGKWFGKEELNDQKDSGQRK